MLEGLRVLDLTDDRGMLCGRMLSDLGADVVIVEPLTGSTARRSAPIDSAGDESMAWHTFSAGKRSVALDLEGLAGRSVLDDLIRDADVLVTSWDHAELDRLRLDPDTVRAAVPGLVYTAITAFGWGGPRSRLAATDLTVWAAGGPLAPHRDGELPPLRISVPQAYLHASADAASGVLLALLERSRSGLGQFVDVSAQVSVGQATLARVLAHAVGDDNPEWQQQPRARSDQSGSGAATPNSLKKWHCRDGIIELHLSMGPAAGAFTNRLFDWIREEGNLDEGVASWDWREVPTLVSEGAIGTEDLDTARAAVRDFLAGKTKAEVVEQALIRRLLSMAIFDTSDVAASPQLAARKFFDTLEIAGRAVSVPSVFAHVDGAPGPRLRGCAPRVGEHTEVVRTEWLGHRSDALSTTDEPRIAPLEGLRVVDLSWVVAGPLIGRTLADFGAEVIRVESSTRVETARMMQPFIGGRPDREGSALFGNCNAGKLGVTLDLRSPEGQSVVRDLVVRADVVVESFSPGQLDRWGLSPEELRELNPRLVVVSSSIAGQNGPWSKLAGFGNVGSSLSGFQDLVGWPDRLPLGPFGPYTDYLGPRTALVALLAALLRREDSGQGCYIDVSQVEAGAYFLAPQLARYGFDGTVAGRRGNTDDRCAPHGVYPVAPDDHGERFLAVAVRDADDRSALCTILDRQDLVDGVDHPATVAELDEALRRWSASMSGESAERALQDAGVPAYLALRPADYVDDPQLRYRGHLVELEHPVRGRTTVEGARVRLSDTPGGPRVSAPTLGQHNRYVLGAILGYDDATVDRLEETGVLR